MLTQGLALGGFEGQGGERFAGAAALLNSAEAGFDAFGEGLTGDSLHAFDNLFHAAVRPDAETDGVLSHPGTGNGLRRC
jgi:hypothetical protein